MASELRVDTLKDSSGNNSVGMAYVSGGSAKAWVNFDGTGTIATRDSFNVSSLNDDGTGKYDVVITNSMTNNDYAVSVGGAYNTGDSDGSTSPTGRRTDLTTSVFGIRGSSLQGASNFTDVSFAFGTIQGDLA